MLLDKASMQHTVGQCMLLSEKMVRSLKHCSIVIYSLHGAKQETATLAAINSISIDMSYFREFH